jgi:hypothetical protein
MHLPFFPAAIFRQVLYREVMIQLLPRTKSCLFGGASKAGPSCLAGRIMWYIRKYVHSSAEVLRLKHQMSLEVDLADLIVAAQFNWRSATSVTDHVERQQGGALETSIAAFQGLKLRFHQ